MEKIHFSYNTGILEINAENIKVQTKLINGKDNKDIKIMKTIELTYDKRITTEKEIAENMKRIDEIKEIISIDTESFGNILNTEKYLGELTNIYIFERTEIETSLMIEFILTFIQGE